MNRKTVADWSAAWMREVVLQKGLASGTVMKYQCAVNHLIRRFGDVPVWDLHLSEFQRYINELAVESPYTGRAMSRASLSNVKKVSQMVFRYAEQNGVDGVPHFFSAVQLPKGTPERGRRALTATEVEMVLHVPHSAQSMAMVMLFAGLRIGECVPLRWSDVDLERGVLRVTRSADLQGNAAVVKDGGKTAAARRLVPLPEVLVRYLRRWKMDQAMGFMTVPEMPTLFELVEAGISAEDWVREKEWRLRHWAGVPEGAPDARNSDGAGWPTEAGPPEDPYGWVFGPPGAQAVYSYKNPPPRVEAEDDLLFTNLSGQMHSKSSLRRLWADYMRALNEAAAPPDAARSPGSPAPAPPIRFTPHDLRHTYATMLYLQDVDIRDAMSYMGHATYQVTLGIYTDTEQYCRFDIDPELAHRLRTDFKVPKPLL